MKPVLAIALGTAAIALSACGSDATPGRASDPAATPASSHAPTDPGPPEVAEPAGSAEELFATIDAALAKETSVRQEMGNLNPPPATVLDQEYGGGEDDLLLEIDLGPAGSMAFARVDGRTWGRGIDGDAFVQGPAPEKDDDSPVSRTLNSDVREDFQRMKAMAGRLSYVDEETVAGQPTYHYRLELGLAAMKNPAILPALVEGPKPADFWIAHSGLPVRVDVRYSEPLAGTPGTGVSRTDYSRWSEPVEPEVE